MKLRILIADDHAILRSGIRSLIEHTAHLEVVGEAADGCEAVQLTRSLIPDVLIVDIAMPRLTGLQALRELMAGGCSTRIIVLSAHSDREYVVDALRAGALGFLAKDAAFGELLEAIDTVSKGRRYLGRGVSELALDGLLDHSQKSDVAAASSSEVDKLSPREREVLRLLAMSHTNDEIAAQLHISVHTVQTYRKRLMEKLGVNRAIDLARFALRHGLASLD